jgi:hypothetical protein
MKTATYLVVLFFGCALFSAAQAQDLKVGQSIGQTQTNEVSTSYHTRARLPRSGVMSLEEIVSITNSSVREEIAEGLANISLQMINSKMDGTLDRLILGSIVSFSTPLTSAKARNIVEHHTMNVKVGYEPRPIGGILSVRVELVPVFCGIGTASRPIAIRDIAQAVDDFDQDVVNNTIEKLTKDLSAEYSIK